VVFFGDRSQVLKFRLLAVIGIVLAFAAVGAGWKWQKQTHQRVHHLAGWSWDGVARDSDLT
jgi:uncharacterized membrane protein YozB (DUF420 family)